jgi:SAM-dependent methyltransferase
VVGFIVAGVVVSTVAAIVMLATARVGSNDVLFDRLVRQASDRYADGSLAGWLFARTKPRIDPVYRAVLLGGLLPPGGTLLDIGCGQGLMLALLIEAEDAVGDGSWPPTRRPPPLFERWVGVETRPRVARLAQSALGQKAQVLQADARELELERCSAVLLFDVLHMMSKEAQAGLLDGIGEVLAPQGVILVREADAAAGWRFALVRLTNRSKAILLGHWRQELRFRSRDEWLACFRSLGWNAEVCSIDGGDPLGNVLFRVSSRDLPDVPVR